MLECKATVLQKTVQCCSPLQHHNANAFILFIDFEIIPEWYRMILQKGTGNLN